MTNTDYQQDDPLGILQKKPAQKVQEDPLGILKKKDNGVSPSELSLDGLDGLKTDEGFEKDAAKANQPYEFFQKRLVGKIVHRQGEKGWGDAVIPIAAKDKFTEPEIKDFQQGDIIEYPKNHPNSKTGYKQLQVKDGKWVWQDIVKPAQLYKEGEEVFKKAVRPKVTPQQAKKQLQERIVKDQDLPMAAYLEMSDSERLNQRLAGNTELYKSVQEEIRTNPDNIRTSEGRFNILNNAIVKKYGLEEDPFQAEKFKNISQDELAQKFQEARAGKPDISYFQRPEIKELLNILDAQNDGVKELGSTLEYFPKYRERILEAEKRYSGTSDKISFLRSLAGGVLDTLSGIAYSATKLNPLSVTNPMIDLKADKIYDDYKLWSAKTFTTPKDTGSDIVNFTNQALRSVPQVAGIIASRNPQLGVLGFIGLPSFSDSYNESLRQGLTKEAAMVKGIADAGIQTVAEAIIPEKRLVAGFKPSKALGELAEKEFGSELFNKTLAKELKTYWNKQPGEFLKNIGGQYLEEQIADKASKLSNEVANAITGAEFDITTSLEDEKNLLGSIALLTIGIKSMGGTFMGTNTKAKSYRDYIIKNAATDPEWGQTVVETLKQDPQINQEYVSEIESDLNNIEQTAQEPLDTSIAAEEINSTALREPKGIINEAIVAAEDIADDGQREAFLSDPEQGLKEAAQQLHGTTGEAETANKFYGKRIADLALELYPTPESAQPTPTPTVKGEEEQPSTVLSRGDVEGKSILNSDVDLKGKPKSGYLWMQTKDGVNKLFEDKNAPEIIFHEHGELFPVEVGFQEGAHKVSVESAIERQSYQQAISDGRMTANDAKTIIESAGLEVPKDILEKATQEQIPSTVTEQEVVEKGQNQGEKVERSVATEGEQGGVAGEQKPPQPPEKEPPKEGADGKPQRHNKAILTRLYESKNIKEQAKKKFEAEGLSYEPKSQDEARELAKGVVDEFGIDEAVLLAEAGRFDGDVNTWIFGEALNRLQEQGASSKTMEEEFESGLQWAETSIRFDEYGRKLGRAISAIYDFYKKSPIGVILKENNNRKEIFEQWYKTKEKGFKELFEELQKDPDFKEYFEKEVSERLKKERTEARKERISKVDKTIDDAINKLKKGDTLYSSIIPPQVFIAALEGVKKAYRAGEAVAKIIQDAIDYVSKELGTGDWDKEKFTNYVNNIVRDKGRQPLTDEEKKQRILDRFRKKLTGLNERQKEEVVQRSMKKLLDAGALEYEDFKKIIAEVIGLKELTSEQVKQIKELQATINNVQDAASKARESRTGDLTEFRKAVKEGELAQMKLDAILYQKAQPLTRFLDIVKLNTLGLVSLIKNVAYNIGWQPIRFGKSVFKTLLDYGIYGTSLLANKTFGSRIISPEENVFLAQKGFFKGVGIGLSRAGLQFRTGLQDRDYYSRETFQGKIKPFQSYRDLYKWYKGELFLTNAQVADKIMQGTGGVNAEFISRTLNIGDKWLKFGAERAKAEQIAKLQLGINPKNKGDFNLFIQFPKEEAYRVFKTKGLTDEEAMAKAEDIEKQIQLEGERSILQNDTWLNNMLSRFDNFLNDKSESSDSVKALAAGLGRVLKALSIPYVKIPINVGWNIVNLTNPEIALAQSALYGYGARAASKKGESIKAGEQWRLSKDYLATAAVGFGLKMAAASLVALGLIRPRNDEEDKYKEKEGERFYGRQNAFNWSAIKRLAILQDPKPKEGDVWVDMSWLGVFGGILNVHSNMAEEKLNKKSRGEEVDESYLDDLMARLEGSVAEGFQNGVFSGTNNLINATKNGGGYVDNLFINYLNMGINFFEPATYAQFSKAMQDEQTTYRADNLWQKIVNNQKQRDIIFRTFISKNKAPSRISIWGEPVKQGNAIQNMLGFSPDDRNKFGVLLWDDYQRTKDERFFPQPTPLTLAVDGKRVKLSAKEAEDLAIITGQNRKSAVSPLVYNMVNYGGKYYQDMTDEEKIDALMIIYEEANRFGFEEFKQRYPKYVNAEKDEYFEDLKKENNKVFRQDIKDVLEK